MTTRPETTAWARDTDRRAHVRTWRPWSTAPKNQEILAWREDAGVMLVEWTTPDTLDPSILELSAGVYEVRYGDMDCSEPDWFCLAPESRLEGDELPTHWMPLPGAPPSDPPLDLTTEEVEDLQDDIAEVLARAMVRYLARKAREAVEARGEEADRG